jgi:hypothetical protein
MTDETWKLTLQLCRRILGRGDWDPYLSDSWCAFTTFSAIKHGITYFNCGFPAENECLDTCTKDGGVWRQSFEYCDLAHLIIPRTFYWERTLNGFQSGYKEQDLLVLAGELEQVHTQFTLSELVLEIKLY